MSSHASPGALSPDGNLGRALRVGFVGLRSPFVKANWSGTPYYAMTELKRRFGGQMSVYDTPELDRRLFQLNKVTSRLGLDIQREPLVSWVYRERLDRMIANHRPHVIVSVGATQKLALTDARVPIVHVSDALFATITGYYPSFRNLSQRTLRLGNAIQQKLLDRCGAVMLSSTWARDDAIAAYDIAPEKVHSVPLGANIEEDPGSDIALEPKGRLRLLFIGMDWKRKGGPRTIEVFRHVRSRHPDAELHIVGCDPPEARGEPNVRTHGMLRKSDKAQYRLFDDLLRTASFFVMPSEQEAYGLAYCEAAAFGLPVVALQTGGVPTIVRHGETGLLFEGSTPPDAIADAIMDLWQDRARYDAFRAAARTRYEEELTWEAWGDRVEQAIRDLGRNAGATG
ncbi:glycosyltransferase family 4 protein [Tsuneonella dongtanensis]|uniref:glycosyltransferase family 4 protein n=1 Tax=Tsuneonella dongtanensis TaxID=692370 RepID=UPI0018DC8EC8|nr:glycosyltransferase family 4 protein [Tsuneonella dongtanensis]